MSKTIKITISVLSICFALGIMVVGIFAATSSAIGISATATWSVNEIAMSINGKISGNKSTDSTNATFYRNLAIGSGNTVETWSIGSFNFEVYDDTTNHLRVCRPVIIRMAFKNTATNDIYYKFTTPPTLNNDLVYTYQLAKGTIGGAETWETDFFATGYSGALTVNASLTGHANYTALEQNSALLKIASGNSAVLEIRLKIADITKNLSGATFSFTITAKNAVVV